MNAAYQCTIFSFWSNIYNHKYYSIQNYNFTVYKIQVLTRLSVHGCENRHSPKNKNIGWTRETLEEPSLLRYDNVSLSESKKFSSDCPTLLRQALQFFEMLGTISPATRCHIPKDSNHEQHHCENHRFCGEISNCETGDSHSCVDEDKGGSFGMQLFKRYQCFRENCASVFSVEYVNPNHTYFSTTLQGFTSQKKAVFNYWLSLRTWCWEMQLFLGHACPHTVICLPSADFGNGGSKSGMSSADRPSTLSTTDFGRSLRPCRLFRFVERWGVACAWMDVTKMVILIYDKTLHRYINLHVRIFFTVAPCILSKSFHLSNWCTIKLL
jgi:hypothetical protein